MKRGMCQTTLCQRYGMDQAREWLASMAMNDVMAQ